MRVTDDEVARDQAARIAEHSLAASNADAEREAALDVLNDFAGGVVPVTAPRLAWAFGVVEGRDDLEVHEVKLLELAWGRVRENADRAEWERLGAHP